MTHDAEAWRDQAACKGMDPGLFFPERGSGQVAIEAVLAVCEGCPSKGPCLAYAMGHGEFEDPSGLWGGTTGRQRRAMRRARRGAA